MAPIIERLDREAELNGTTADLPGTTLLQALKPRFGGETPKVDVDALVLVESENYKNISLLRGDIGLNAAEDDFSQAHVQRLSNQTHFKFSYVAMYDMLQRLGAKYNADYIFLDVGPSAGAITRTCFLASDMFYVPVAPDRFNFQAIESLAEIIDLWMEEHAVVVPRFREIGLDVSEGKPLFLGDIMQNYKLARGEEARPGYKLWMNRIPDQLNNTLIPVLKKHSNDSRDLVGIAVKEGVEAVRIPDFQTGATLMQEFAKPVYDIQKDDTKSVNKGTPYQGKVWDDLEKRMGEWRALFERLAGRIIQADQYLVSKGKS